MLIYLSLFASALLAATLIPAQSEAVLVSSIIARPDEIGLLIAIASAGNILGSLVNWGLGRFAGSRATRLFKLDSGSVKRAQSWYQKWGWWSLFASWVPIVGDPLTFIAGLMKEPLWRFLLVVSVAKTGRYVVLAWMVQSSL